jgi:arginine deiminase
LRRNFGADSEVGCLRTVLMHRPGPELRRVTPRTRNQLRFDNLPWVARAQQEHDVLADALRVLGIEVIYLTEFLRDVLEYASARDEAISSVVANCELGDELAGIVKTHLEELNPGDLASALMAGLTPGELRTGRGLVYDLLDPHDFVVEPLPNLVFGKDSSVWIGDQAVVGTLAPPRRRESDLLAVIYGHHPRFAGIGGTRPPYRAECGLLHGGDVVLLGPGVVAVGVGARTMPASAEQLARHLLETGIATNVLIVPRACHGQGHGQDDHLDMACTVLDVGVVLMVPAIAFRLTALSITARRGELRISRPMPFLEAAARALNIDQMTVVDTGIDSLISAGGQWDDAGNALVVGGQTVICDERNSDTNARLAAAGFEVIVVPCGELGRMRGGPRSMCVPLLRDPAVLPDHGQASLDSAAPILGQWLGRLSGSEADSARPSKPAEPVPDQVGSSSELAPLR